MHEILNTRIWSFETNYFSAIAPVILKRIANGGNIDALIQDPEKREYGAGITWDRETSLPIYDAGEMQYVAIISIVGSMTKYGGACSYGTKDLSNMLARVNAAPHIKGAVIIMDSPGGAVDGLPEFATMVANSAKPVAGFIDGMMCSAMLWSGSQTKWIVANKYNYATIGSIGTLCMRIDQTQWLQKEGLKVTIHRAAQSTDKAVLNPFEEAPSEAIAALEAELTAITEDFIAAVKAGRGDKLQAGDENIFTGKTYSKEDALAMGMIDGIGTLEDAVAKVLELAAGPKIDSETTPLKPTSKSNMKADKILGFLGFGKQEVEGKLSAEQVAALEAAEDKLAQLETANAAQVSNLQAQIDALTGEKTSLLAQAAQQASAIEEKDQKIALLESNGETPTGATKEGDNNAGSTKADKPMNSWEAKAAKKTNSLK